MVTIYLHNKSNRRVQGTSESSVDNIKKEMPKQNINPPTQASVTATKPQETEQDGGVKDFESGLAFYKEKNYTEAKRLFESAVNNGNADAMCYIGILYHFGYGVPQDYQEAMEWHKKAAEKGNAAAMGSIGFLYRYGLGVEKNYQKAREYFQKAFDMGNDSAKKFAKKELEELP